MEINKDKQFIDKESLALFRSIFWKKCKDLGITLEDLADRTGIHYNQIYRIVRGTKNTSLSNVIAVIRAAGFQPSEIFTFEISIPDYPPLRRENVDISGKRIKKTPGAKFFITTYLENGHFDVVGLTPAEITKHVNEDLDKEFEEQDFSSAFSKIFNGRREKNQFKRIAEGSTYRYFPLSDEEKNAVTTEKRKMKRKS